MDDPANYVYLPPPYTFDPGFNFMRSQHQLPPLQTFSDEDMSEPGPSSSKLPRRGTRACDRCRKIKSKCEGSEGEKCKNCVAAGTACTFQGPSYKRGPPKGYIHAIEQRWHQVECVLATVMALPRAQDIIADMRTDDFARDILDRVASGPYGSVGQSATNAMIPGEDGFYNAIMGQSASEDRRSKRQSRQTREFVSSQDSAVSALPTAEWQEQLYRRLATSQGHQRSGVASPYSTASSSDRARMPSYSSSSGQPSPVGLVPHMPGYSGQPSRRRRIEPSVSSSTVPESERSSLHRSAERELAAEEAEEFDEATDTFGHLSVDQNNEFRYHGRSAGLHLLAKSDRKDDSQAQENGIWKFNIPKMEAGCQCLSFEKVNDEIELPDFRMQDQLVTAYFSYVHHVFPVVHKASFLAIYNERQLDLPNKVVSGGKPQPMQTVTKLLLLAIFANAAHFLPVEGKKPYDVAKEFALKARRLINTQYEDSKPSTCQALLLLGLREFGMGCLSQGWMYTGMGCRMAIDLGLNRDGDNWKDASGRDLFSPIDKQIRRQIWWSCCITDKVCSVWLGRPVTFKKGDFSTAEPDFDLNDDEELWKPYPRDLLGRDFAPMAGRVMGCFKEQCRLSFIISEIMAKLYPVKLFEDGNSRRVWRDELESALQQWLINLPEELQYREATNKAVVPPHVIILHIEYHAAMLLLHRSFLPNWKTHQRYRTEKDTNAAHNWCLDICLAAAAKISSLIEAFDGIYSLTRAPPLLLSYLQSAGIMHAVTLTRRPRDTQATIGLMQSIRAAEVLEDVWPEAIRIKNLLKGAHVEMDNIAELNQSAVSRPKRGLDEVLGEDRSADLLFNVQSPHPSYSMYTGPNMPSSSSDPMSYIPGYEWWPQLIGPGTGGGYTPQDYRTYHPSPLGPQLVPPQGLFTFDQSQLSTDFMHDVDPSGTGHVPQAGPSSQPSHPHPQGSAPNPNVRHEHQHHEHYGHHGYPPS